MKHGTLSEWTGISVRKTLRSSFSAHGAPRTAHTARLAQDVTTSISRSGLPSSLGSACSGGSSSSEPVTGFGWRLEEQKLGCFCGGAFPASSKES